MNQQEIIDQAFKYIREALSGAEVENPKVDLKSGWYNLKDLNEKSEFIKDTSSIANTVGSDGLIILGIDEKSKKLIGVSFSDSGLKDTNELTGLVSKRVDRPFDLNYYEEKIRHDDMEYNIGVLHIPPSLDKPHVVRNHQKRRKDKEVKNDEQRIFVRKNTRTAYASKSDIELMIWDRKNIIPDYMFFASISDLKSISSREVANLDCYLTIENLGKRPASIVELSLILTLKRDKTRSHLYDSFLWIRSQKVPNPSLKAQNLIIRTNDIVNQQFKFKKNPSSSRLPERIELNWFDIEMRLTLNNKKEILVPVEIIE